MLLCAQALPAQSAPDRADESGAHGGATPPASFDFRHDILPRLHRQGCASAYCHGSATGRGGFKLSLFGSDPDADFRAITADLGGRRIDLRDAAHSLLLRKPTLDLDHGGGRRLRRDDTNYRALRGWIEAGAPQRIGPSRQLDELELVERSERLVATAHFDGAGTARRDVTTLCSFHSSDERVVTVDGDGRLSRHGPGEAFVFARYLGHSARLAVLRPFAEPSTLPQQRADHALDAVWLRRLRELGLTPAPPAPPEVLLRRLYLDLAETLPRPADVAAFRANPDPGVVADRLMRLPSFADRFGRLLAETFEIPSITDKLPGARARLFEVQRTRLVEALRRGDTLHAIAERLLTSDRALLERHEDPRDRAELVGRAFLGVRIGCARCHDSPVDRWRQGEHLAFAAMFASPRPRAGGGMASGVLFHPDTGTPVPPHLLPVRSQTAPPRGLDHAAQVAWFVLRSGNRMFERNLANRVFAALLGRGLVEPLDDHRLSNPATHEAVLAHLAEVAAGGDLRALVRHLVTSALYRASSAAGASHEVAWFARRSARPMPREPFEHAVSDALAARPPA
ncbi:MAG: DUF1549 domain-containing protein, partial [Planctomycetes bacterium]|nr:DUF1549 domain-containing protein [Planctomycetota bacterium]